MGQDCPLDYGVMENTDEVVVAVAPGEQADQYCGLHVHFDSREKTYYKILSVRP